MAEIVGLSFSLTHETDLGLVSFFFCKIHIA